MTETPQAGDERYAVSYYVDEPAPHGRRQVTVLHGSPVYFTRPHDALVWIHRQDERRQMDGQLPAVRIAVRHQILGYVGAQLLWTDAGRDDACQQIQEAIR